MQTVTGYQMMNGLKLQGRNMINQRLLKIMRLPIINLLKNQRLLMNLTIFVGRIIKERQVMFLKIVFTNKLISQYGKVIVLH